MPSSNCKRLNLLNDIAASSGYDKVVRRWMVMATAPAPGALGPSMGTKVDGDGNGGDDNGNGGDGDDDGG